MNKNVNKIKVTNKIQLMNNIEKKEKIIDL